MSIIKKTNCRFKRNKKIKIWITVQTKCLNIGLLSRTDFSGNVKSVKNRFILNDPKKLFTLKESNYQEVYTYKLRNDKNLDYAVLMMKQKFDS